MEPHRNYELSGSSKAQFTNSEINLISNLQGDINSRHEEPSLQRPGIIVSWKNQQRSVAKHMQTEHVQNNCIIATRMQKGDTS